MAMDFWFEPVKAIEITGADLTISPVHMVAVDKGGSGRYCPAFPAVPAPAG
jgi:hypothetical protein